MDKLVTGYSCKRKTLCWPLFFNIMDISAYNAFVIWMALNPDWNRGKLQRRRYFLEELGKALVRPQMQRREHIPRSTASAAIVRIQEEDAGAPSAQPTEPPTAEPESKCVLLLHMYGENGVGCHTGWLSHSYRHQRALSPKLWYGNVQQWDQSSPTLKKIMQ